jgi:Domain of unknown function (DUF4404)
MERQELTAKLAQLHTELASADEVDPESLDLLRKLTTDIARLLEAKGSVAPEEAEGVSNGLKDLLLKFEAEHPELSITLGKVADALAAIGI